MEIRNLEIIPRGVSPVINVSQYDVGRTFKFLLFDGDLAYVIPSGAVVRVEGIKKDKTGFSYECEYSGNEVTVEVTRQMTVFSGEVKSELRIVYNEVNIGTLNFILKVEDSPITDETNISETEIPAIIELATEQMEAAAESASQAASSAESASESEEQSEAWATGKINGVDVSSTAPQYQNNSKFFAEAAAESASQAASSAEGASDSEEQSEAWATGKINGIDVPSTAPQYQNNSKFFAEKAAELTAKMPYVGNNGNWFIFDIQNNQYVDSGYPSRGVQGDTGNGIFSIVKTGTSGLVDTYTITYTDGTTTTFNVTNGRDGTGAGDMLKADYDSNNEVEDAGGIATFVSDQISNKQNSTDNNLETTDKTIVGAINELNTNKQNSTDNNLNTTEKTVVGAINELNAKAYLTDDATETVLASNDLLPFYDFSATVKKKMSVENFGQQLISNPNILDNPWFTINQRGENSYTNGTTTGKLSVDRWIIHGLTTGSIIVSVIENGVDITASSDASSNLTFYQMIEKNILGMTVTASIIIDGVLYSATGTIPSQKSDQWVIAFQKEIFENCKIIIYVGSTATPEKNAAFYLSLPRDGISRNIKAAKLEVGNISTLLLDSPPDYSTELLKCQRYFYNANFYKNTYEEIGTGFYEGGGYDTCYVNVPIHVPMRATPTMTMSGDCRGFIDGTNYAISGYTAFVSRLSPVYVKIGIKKTISAAQFKVGIFSFSGNVGVLQFSADI